MNSEMTACTTMPKYNAKIAMIGSGMIGGTLGMMAGMKNLSNDIVMIDVMEGVAEGKSLDMSQACACEGNNVKFSGFDIKDGVYSGLENADVCIITAGFPRTDGMTRQDLLHKNTAVITSVGNAIRTHCPNAFVICITNPLDVMVNLLQTVSGLPPQKVVGMAGVLDTSRFRHFLAEEMNVSPMDIQSLVLGGHGDDMVPMKSMTSVSGIPLSTCVQMGMITEEKLDGIIDRTRKGGAEIVSYLKKGSAFVAPAVSAIQMTQSYLRNEKRIFPCCAFLSGEYGYKNIYGGVPVVIGSNGVEKVLQLPLNDMESSMFKTSMEEVEKLVAACPGLAKASA